MRAHKKEFTRNKRTKNPSQRQAAKNTAEKKLTMGNKSPPEHLQPLGGSDMIWDKNLHGVHGKDILSGKLSAAV